ncbi:MAG: hypothetical protein GY928_34215 [Colwellia sp.]|nr:hypothetical protein [Colwellia sp.]
MNLENLTDGQLGVIGYEAGKAFADEFWDRVKESNGYKFRPRPAEYLLRELGKAIGKGLADVKAEECKIGLAEQEEIAVRSLIGKYKHNVEYPNNRKQWVPILKKVLRFYLDEGEMTLLVKAVEAGNLPDDPLDLFE